LSATSSRVYVHCREPTSFPGGPGGEGSSEWGRETRPREVTSRAGPLRTRANEIPRVRPPPPPPLGAVCFERAPGRGALGGHRKVSQTAIFGREPGRGPRGSLFESQRSGPLVRVLPGEAGLRLGEYTLWSSARCPHFEDRPENPFRRRGRGIAGGAARGTATPSGDCKAFWLD